MRDKRRGDPAYARDAKLRALYGISLDEFNELLREQEGLCAICRVEPATCVDHDHGTSEVRGLLCRACNSGLGFFRDDMTSLENALAYIER